VSPIWALKSAAPGPMHYLSSEVARPGSSLHIDRLEGTNHMLSRIRKAAEDKDSGFTLIELLVVMIIIGILAAIAIPVFLNQRKKAVDTSIKSDLRTVANEEETNYTDAQAYVAVASTTGTAAVGNTVTLSSGNNIQVVLSTDGNAYRICGWNAKATANAAGKMWTYVSNAGGLQSATVATCAVP
jgi:type IV pilus assembly protein PilA